MAGTRFSRSRGSIGVGLAALLGILAVTLLFFAVVVIESGNVGVKKTLGKVQPEEITPGLSLRIPANMRGFEMILPTDKLAQQ